MTVLGVSKVNVKSEHVNRVPFKFVVCANVKIAFKLLLQCQLLIL